MDTRGSWLVGKVESSIQGTEQTNLATSTELSTIIEMSSYWRNERCNFVE